MRAESSLTESFVVVVVASLFFPVRYRVFCFVLGGWEQGVGRGGGFVWDPCGECLEVLHVTRLRVHKGLHCQLFQMCAHVDSNHE